MKVVEETIRKLENRTEIYPEWSTEKQKVVLNIKY